MLKTTNDHKKYWKERKIDWDAHYLATWNHPHRELIMYALTMFPWVSLWELGCGPGANLVRIVKSFKNKNLGGSDINEDAIALARKTFVGGRFRVESSEDTLMSENSVDVVLSDAHLIYFGPTKINKVVKEMVRIARNNLVLFELHEPSLLKRIWLRLRRGYNAYDYRKLLESNGCYNVQIIKMPKQYWPGTPWEEYGHIIIAKPIKIQ